MSRGLLMSLLALDLFVMGISSYVMWDRVRKHFLSSTKDPMPGQIEAKAGSGLPSSGQEQMSRVTAETSSLTNLSQKPEVTAAKNADSKISGRQSVPTGALKKVSFHYRDPIPKKVAIVGEFNQWTPQPMSKDPDSNWTVSLELKSGKYAYNFIVDDKMIRDPSNPKIMKTGRKIPFSVIEVKAK